MKFYYLDERALNSDSSMLLLGIPHGEQWFTKYLTRILMALLLMKSSLLLRLAIVPTTAPKDFAFGNSVGDLGENSAATIASSAVKAIGSLLVLLLFWVRVRLSPPYCYTDSTIFTEQAARECV